MDAALRVVLTKLHDLWASVKSEQNLQSGVIEGAAFGTWHGADLVA